MNANIHNHFVVNEYFMIKNKDKNVENVLKKNVGMC